MEELLTFDAVEVAYGSGPVLQGVTFSLHPGEIAAVVGASGSGKSTLLKAAMGILQGGAVTGGEIRFRGRDLAACAPGELRRMRGAEISMVFQDTGAYLCPIRTIESQMREAVRAHRKASKEEVRAMALALLARLRLEDPARILQSYPFALSGGQLQRVGIAMAMLLKPPVLLCDEPTSALDMVAQRKVLDELRALRADYGTAILLVTHDMGVVSALADTVLVLREGQVAEYGPARQVLSQPRSRETQALLAAAPRLRR